jgi:hypothetical protein
MYSQKQIPSRYKKRRMDKSIIYGLIVVLMLIAIVVVTIIFLRNDEVVEESIFTNDAAQSQQEQQEPKTSLRFVATGDVIAHDALNFRAEQDGGGYDYYQFMDKMQPYFDQADVSFCNQAVLGGGEQFGIDGYPVFNSPTEVARDMARVGCNLINAGTNHTNDLNQAAIDATVDSWDDLDVFAVAGANRSQEEYDAVRYFEQDGVKFAFVSYTTYTNDVGETNYGLTFYDEELARRQLTEAEAQADITIVSMRWGIEYSQGATAVQRGQAQLLGDLGADIILGHGPHVVAPYEKLTSATGSDVHTWYSLGNFLNAQLDAETLFNGFAVMDIDIASKIVTDVSFLPVYMHYEWTPEEKAREDLLARDNFEMYVIDEAAEPLARSQLNTTVEAQIERMRTTLNSISPVIFLTSETY